MPEHHPKSHSTALLLDLTKALSEATGVKSGQKAGVATGLRGNRDAADRLLELVYDDLRALAASQLRRENAGHTLQPTALAHEVYMHLIDQHSVDWKGKSHFMAIAAQAMRRILIDHARGRDRQKRGGGWQRVALDHPAVAPEDKPKSNDVDIELLDSVLHKLSELDPRQAKIVEMRYLAGMTVEEVAEALGVSKRTVEGDWTMARAWLRKELAGAG